MTFRPRTIVLMLLALPGLATQWVPFFETHDSFSARSYAFIDFLDLPATGYPQDWLERTLYIIDTLPIFLPLVVLQPQLRQLTETSSVDRNTGRTAWVAATVWVAYYAAVSLWKLPPQSLMGWDDVLQQRSILPLPDEAIRVIVLFGPMLAAVWLLIRLRRTSTIENSSDLTECAAMTVYIVAVVPELVTDGLSAVRHLDRGHLLPGYSLLLWTCVVYGFTLAVRLGEQDAQPRHASNPG